MPAKGKRACNLGPIAPTSISKFDAAFKRYADATPSKDFFRSARALLGDGLRGRIGMASNA
eukprot:2448593-Pyramimonas_sp.AAC.1